MVMLLYLKHAVQARLDAGAAYLQALVDDAIRVGSGHGCWRRPDLDPGVQPRRSPRRGPGW